MSAEIKNLEWIPQVEGMDYLKEGSVRPFISMRRENLSDLNTSLRHCVSDFALEPLLYYPHDLEDMKFIRAILCVDQLTFAHNAMVMPKWVFYDCGVLPGLVSGFAAKKESLPKSFVEECFGDYGKELEWVPLSLFIMIPSIRPGEWVAHNLCSINFIKQVHFPGLGFLSKLVGMLYGGVQSCLGMTQWNSPALKIHSFYGPLKVEAAYNYIHSHKSTLTYNLQLREPFVRAFFAKEERKALFESHFQALDKQVYPDDKESLKELHRQIYVGGPAVYCNSLEVFQGNMGRGVTLYRLIEDSV